MNGNYYYLSRRKVKKPMQPQQALGDTLDSLTNILGGPIAGVMTSAEIGLMSSSPGIQNCIDQANASARVAALDSRTQDLSKNWQPTGFYTPQQINDITGQIQALLTTSAVQVSLAPFSQSDSATQIQQAIDSIQKKIAAGQAYSAAASQAAQNPTSGIVNAPGLKNWVVTSMAVASQAIVTAYAMACDQSALENVLSLVAGFYDTAWNVIKAIPGVIAKAGDFIVSAADTLDKVLTVAKWAILIGGGYFLYTKAKEAGYLKKLVGKK